MSVELKEGEAEVIEQVGIDPELELAKKHGYLQDEPEVENDEESSGEASEAETEEVEDVEKTEEQTQEQVTFEQMDQDLASSPDEFHKKYDSNAKALYFKQKKYKQRAQDAEAEKELLQVKLKAMEEQIEALKKPQEEEIDEDEPVTRKDLERLNLEREEKSKREAEDKEAKLKAQAKKIKEHLDLQEAEARSKYEDYEETVSLAQRVLKEGVLDKYEAEYYQSLYNEKILNMADDLADFAYLLGKKHPDYGKGKVNGKQDKETVKKMVANAEKRQGSASLGGGAGGNSVKSVEDMTLQDVARLPEAEQLEIRKKHPKVWQRLLRA